MFFDFYLIITFYYTIVLDPGYLKPFMVKLEMLDEEMRNSFEFRRENYQKNEKYKVNYLSLIHI